MSQPSVSSERWENGTTAAAAASALWRRGTPFARGCSEGLGRPSGSTGGSPLAELARSRAHSPEIRSMVKAFAHADGRCGRRAICWNVGPRTERASPVRGGARKITRKVSPGPRQPGARRSIVSLAAECRAPRARSRKELAGVAQLAVGVVRVGDRGPGGGGPRGVGPEAEPRRPKPRTRPEGPRKPEAQDAEAQEAAQDLAQEVRPGGRGPGGGRPGGVVHGDVRPAGRRHEVPPPSPVGDDELVQRRVRVGRVRDRRSPSAPSTSPTPSDPRRRWVCPWPSA